MSPENQNPDDKRSVGETILHKAILLTEAGTNLKERFSAGEKHLSYLKSLVHEAERAVISLQNISKSSLHIAWQLSLAGIADDNFAPQLKVEFQKLSNIIEKQLNDYDLQKFNENTESMSMLQMSEKIKFLEARQKISDVNLPTTTLSNKCFKADIDEKYPENLSRESLIDLNNVSNLAPVPEDIFTSFSSKPTRSSSLSSLKSMRKIKLFLQKAESSDEEESSDNDEHEYSRLIYGDSDDSRTSCGSYSPMSKKAHLGNIKEEAQD